MKKTRILAIVPYEEMKNAMERLAAERSDISLTVRLGNITTCASILKEYENSPFDVIISRGGTANLLRSLAVIPVVEITVTIYDILRSLKSVESFTGKFAVVGFENITDCVKQLSAMLQYDVTVCTITERSNIKKELLNLRAQGVELVLCDKISTINAEELGMNSIFIASDDASITAAFSEAVHIASLCRNFKKQNAIMHSLLLAQDFHTLVFDERGTLLFSTPDEGLLAEFGVSPSALAAAFSAQSSRQEREYERGGRYLSVKSSWLSCGGQPSVPAPSDVAVSAPVERTRNQPVRQHNAHRRRSRSDGQYRLHGRDQPHDHRLLFVRAPRAHPGRKGNGQGHRRVNHLQKRAVPQQKTSDD
ncbi:MAG: PrpR N-terminal domain-containing protein [Pyramidobacter sp.]|nr:PrpR N-terminal domain-containing protein [Pyramidobacter sp.]